MYGCLSVQIGKFITEINWNKISKRIFETWICFSSLNIITLFDLKLSPCSERRILSLGWCPGTWILCADVSEHSVSSILIGGVSRTPPTKTELTECSETSAHKIKALRNYPKERIHHYTCHKVKTVSNFEYASLTLVIRYFNTFHIPRIN